MLESKEETMNRKRRLLLQQSAKQSKLLRLSPPQQQQQQQPQQQQNKRARVAPCTTTTATKMTVSFDTMKGDEIIVIPSLDDYTQNELESSYFSKNEYANIIQRVHQTVKYLRRKDTSSDSDSSASAAVVMEDENETIIEHEKDVENDYHCVRGLETYAEEYVGNHRKRVQRISKSAVFRYQKQQLRLKKRRTETKKSVSNVSNVNELAEIYKRSSKGCQEIANRWGYFDAIDAGIIGTVGTDTDGIVADTDADAVKTTTAATTEIVAVVPTTNVTATTVVRCISDECIDQNHPKKKNRSSFRNTNSNSNIIITPIEKREDVFVTATATATTAAAVTTMTMMMNNSWKNEFSKTPVSRKVSY
jgi:hypothetical protein